MCKTRSLMLGRVSYMQAGAAVEYWAIVTLWDNARPW
jgi:hypothetical protein